MSSFLKKHLSHDIQQINLQNPLINLQASYYKGKKTCRFIKGFCR